MRTTIIPAQITTVEDKIAGSLNMTQILILVSSVLWTALIYIFLVPTMKLVPYKVGLILGVIFICIGLIIRIKEKIVAEWLRILILYRMRPKYYLFNKKDKTFRKYLETELDLEDKTAKHMAHKPAHVKTEDISLPDLVKLDHLIITRKVAFRYQFDKKPL